MHNFLIVLSIPLIISITGCNKIREEMEREKADRADAAAQLETDRIVQIEKVAKERSEQVSTLRKRCKVPENKPIYLEYGNNIIDHCQNIVMSNLTVPGSGDFPGPRDEDRSQFATYDGCNMIYESYVDAKNAFGIKVRTKYECTYNPRTGIYSVK